MNRWIRVVSVVAIMLSMVGIAAAEDIVIGPDDVNPINVLVDPNPISPPVKVFFNGWTTDSTYRVTVTNDATSTTVCDTGVQPITSNHQEADLSSCKIPASSIGQSHTIEASADCPQGTCKNKHRSKHLTIDGALNPVPEVASIALVGVGMLGLFGLVRFQRKD